MKAETIRITIEINKASLEHLDDQYIGLYWHVAQANQAAHDDLAAAELVEKLGTEIIRRWLSSQGPVLYNHQPSSAYLAMLSKHGYWEDGVWTPGCPVGSSEVA